MAISDTRQRHFLFSHLVMVGVTTDTFALIFGDFCCDRVQYQQSGAYIGSRRLSWTAKPSRKEITCLIRSPTRLGEPGNVAQQPTLLDNMLSMARGMTQPGLVIKFLLGGGASPTRPFARLVA